MLHRSATDWLGLIDFMEKPSRDDYVTTEGKARRQATGLWSVAGSDRTLALAQSAIRAQLCQIVNDECKIFWKMLSNNYHKKK